MLRFTLAVAAAVMLSASAMAQAPDSSAAKTASLAWMQGARVHTNADGSQVHEAFLGPANGVVTGTALFPLGTDRAFTEYHRIGPNPEGVYGLDVANTRNDMKWTFTPLKEIRPDRIIFQSVDGKSTIMYADDGAGGVNAQVDRIGADGKATTQTWQFKPLKAH